MRKSKALLFLLYSLSFFFLKEGLSEDRSKPATTTESTPLLGILPPSSASDTTNKKALNLDQDGNGLSLGEALGPLVINEDGSTSRIGNWAEMTDHEKQDVIRIVGARNRRRTQLLQERGEKTEL